MQGLEHELEALLQTHPRPRGVREGLRRARRDHPHHPQVRRQGGLGGEDHEALRARRRADRRDPRAEAVSSRAARDPRHPERARRQAEAGAPDCERCSRTRTAAGRLVRDETGRDSGRSTARRQAPHARSRRDEEVSFTADDFIVEEDNVVIVSRDGWVKRQKEVRDLSTTRLREGDCRAGRAAGQHARHRRVLHQLRRRLHARIIDVPASTGYGEPIEKLFKLRDGERIIAAYSLDPRVVGDITTRRGKATPPPVHALAVTQRRIRAALQRRAVRRGEHARRPSLRQAGRRSRSRRRREGRPARRSSSPPPREARATALPGRRDQLSVRPGEGRHPDQAARGRRPGARLHRLDGRSRSDARRNEPRRRADDQHRQIRGHRPRRQGARTAAARPVHADHPERGRKPAAPGFVGPGFSRPWSGRAVFTRHDKQTRRSRRIDGLRRLQVLPHCVGLPVVWRRWSSCSSCKAFVTSFAIPRVPRILPRLSRIPAARPLSLRRRG